MRDITTESALLLFIGSRCWFSLARSLDSLLFIWRGVCIYAESECYERAYIRIDLIKGSSFTPRPERRNINKLALGCGVGGEE